MIKELLNIPAAKWRRLAALKEQIEKLGQEMSNLLLEASPAPIKRVLQAKRKMSAAARKKISDAAKARWAKVRAGAKK
jgi:hypothetical protein